VLFAPESALAIELQRLVEIRGGSCVVTTTLDAAQLQGIRGVVHLAALDISDPIDQLHVCGNALDSFQAMTKAASNPSPRFWMLTRDAQRCFAVPQP
jgi:hypothetical protein